MKCPKCGYNRQKRDDAFVPATECPSCGLVYAKHDVIATQGLPISTAGVSAPLRKSAVDPESLKKARDRVEKRLRNRLEPRLDQDERHAQTLEMARKLTDKSVLKPDKREIQVRNTATDETTQEPQNDTPEKTEKLSEEALMLNEVVGVQIHNGAQESSPEILGAEIEDEPIQAGEADTDDWAASDPNTQDAQSDEPSEMDSDFDDTEAEPVFAEAETDPDFDDIDDVQTETVVLDTTTDMNAESTVEIPEFDETYEADSTDMSSKIEMPPAYIADASPSIETTQFGAGLRRLLPIVAWLILFSGVVGAVLSWTTISNVEAGVNISTPNNPATLPLGLLLGFAYLATGALGFAFFWVSSMINRQLKDIRQLLMAHPMAHTSAEATTDLPDAYEEIESL